jgi:hypothetical protein
MQSTIRKKENQLKVYDDLDIFLIINLVFFRLFIDEKKGEDDKKIN